MIWAASRTYDLVASKSKNMKKLIAISCCLIAFAGTSAAQDIAALEKIGPVVSFTKS